MNSYTNRTVFPVFLSLFFSFLLLLYIFFPDHPGLVRNSVSGSCGGVRELGDFGSKCAYVRTHGGCHSKGYLNYGEMFYCSSTTSPALGYAVLLMWLVVLFYLLGHTASEYFCPAVAGLSGALKLPATIAGTTLLPLGNGANDVFSSIIAFTRSGDADVGINGVLGGAFFICCFVVGIVSVSVSCRGARVHGPSFVRDVLFFLFVLCCLLIIVAVGQINLWIALCFAGLYVVYILLVSVMQLFYCDHNEDVRTGEFSSSVSVPLLGCPGDEEKGLLGEDSPGNDRKQESGRVDDKPWWRWLLLAVELPLDLPRKLTIPTVSEENWYKPFAVIQWTLAPILLGGLYTMQGEEGDFHPSSIILTGAGLTGIILGTLTLVFVTGLPKNGLILVPWLAGGFLMSIVWTYILAEELVSLLITFGDILGISPSILGFTVLAWGNSLGDLISDVTIALKGGPGGVQVAVSGCYAGSLFNTLVGLGLSLVLAAWGEYPNHYGVPRSCDVYETVGFLMVGLVWALVVLPKRNMQLDRFLGVGLLVIYLSFLMLRLGKSVGLIGTTLGC